MARSLLDPGQIIKSAFDDASESFKIQNSGGTLVPEEYDEIDLTYIVAGNGSGEVGVVVYKLAGNTIATLTLAYDASNRLTQVVKS